ncbi:MAG TPA: flagellar biosynthetic protein FliQ [Acidisarcina sp.]|nr:flagellar biosynthetic protein FliQ [Acidisarcina sp.]
MSPDQVAELMRQLLKEALIVSGPVLLAASAISFLLSLVQTLTSLQEQTLTAVPRMLIVVGLLLVGMPWFLKRLIVYTLSLFGDFHRYLG